MVMQPGLTEPIKSQIKNNLRQVTVEIEDMLRQMDSSDCRILSEFEHVHDVFSDLQRTTASHYLNAYLSPFTDSYQAFSTAIQHFSERKHGALMAIQRKDELEPMLYSGTPISAKVSAALLESIFYPELKGEKARNEA
uniref:DAC domain-containing protein n=1 Tax=Batrachochytrium dendrobatidis (strain JAM81 / FGSC 10211) TaxID=684364 RepID=F4PFY3_BATDJ|eukprot:XP_006683514.1 hypothetical protein BATDEDRAFT_29017 [Batrachochytrium dendrobatidis JAM81]